MQLQSPEILDDLCNELTRLYTKLKENSLQNCDVDLSADDATPVIERLPDWVKIFILKGHKNNIVDLKWSEGSRYIITTDSNNMIILWKGNSGLIHNVVRNSDDQLVTSTCLNDASVIISGGSSGKLFVYNCQHRPESDGYSEYVVETCIELPGGVTDIHYDMQFESVIVADDIQGVTLLKLDTLQSMATCYNSSGIINKVKMLNNGNILCGCSDGRCCLYDSRMGRKNLVINYFGHSAQVQCLDLHPVNSSFISGSDDRTVNFFDLRANIPMKTYSISNCKSAKFTRNFGENRKKCVLFEQDDNIHEITDCCFTPSGRLFMSAIRYGSIFVWDIFQNSQPIIDTSFPGTMRKLQMSSSRDKVAIVIWNTENAVDIYEPFIERH